MKLFVTLFRANLRFYTRTKRFLVILPTYLVISTLFPILVILGVAPRSPDIYTYTQSGFLTFSFSAALVSGLLAGDSLSQDFSRQGLFILSQPVKRSTIFLSRYLAAFLATAIILDFFYDLLGISFAGYIYGMLAPNPVLIVLTSLLYVASTVAFVTLFSAASRSPSVSMVASILSVWVLMPLITNALAFFHVEPWFLLSYAGNVMQALAQRTYPPPVQSVSIGGVGSNLPTEQVYNPALWESVAIMAGYIIISLFLAWMIYSRRELKETT